MEYVKNTLRRALTPCWKMVFECSQLLHLMDPSERPQELWGKIRVGLNTGTKSLPARTHPASLHPAGKCTVLKSGILQQLGYSAVKCWC